MISNIYSLPQIDFVGGSSESFIFNLYYSGDRDTPYGLVGCDANFSIINYINKNGDPVVSKKMNIEASSDSMFYNSLTVNLDPSDTVNLCGKYIYQIIIKDIDGNVEIPQQGIIYIHNNINKNYLK